METRKHKTGPARQSLSCSQMPQNKQKQQRLQGQTQRADRYVQLAKKDRTYELNSKFDKTSNFFKVITI
jgi:hypothetical protein